MQFFPGVLWSKALRLKLTGIEMRANISHCFRQNYWLLMMAIVQYKRSISSHTYLNQWLFGEKTKRQFFGGDSPSCFGFFHIDLVSQRNCRWDLAWSKVKKGPAAFRISIAFGCMCCLMCVKGWRGTVLSTIVLSDHDFKSEGAKWQKKKIMADATEEKTSGDRMGVRSAVLRAERGAGCHHLLPTCTPHSSHINLSRSQQYKAPFRQAISTKMCSSLSTCIEVIHLGNRPGRWYDLWEVCLNALQSISLAALKEFS